MKERITGQPKKSSIKRTRLMNLKVYRAALLAVAALSLSMGLKAQNFSYTTPLVAARSNEIGEVLVERDGDSLDVTYTVTNSNWSMSATYMHAASTAAGIPTSLTGVPDIQSFDHKRKHDDVSVYKYDNIDVSGMPYVYVATNANVTQAAKCVVDTAIINASIPTDPVFMVLSLVAQPSYFEMFVYDLNGNAIYQDYFFGNCVDLDHPIFEGTRYYPYTVSSYSADTALLNCMVDKPENLDLVNYIINQDFASSIGAGGTEIQAAIWTLIDDDIPVSGQVGIVFDQTKVDYIVAEARAKGEFYLPECDGYVAVLLDQGCVDALNNNTTPNVTTQQSIFWLPMSSFPNAYEYSYGECANAWGKGKRFNYTGWGMYFNPR